MNYLINNSIQDNNSGIIRNRKISIISLSIFCFLFAFLFENNVAFAQSYYSKVEHDSCVLTKLVSDTSVNSGRNFTYKVTFSIPPGVSNVNITDDLPSTLEFVSSWPPPVVILACAPGTAVSATESVIPPYTRGAHYSLTGILPVPSPCWVTGSFMITVRFPPGITCDGTVARNRVCMNYSINQGKGEFCTDYVTTIAHAKSTWKISKTILNAAYQGGTCPNAVIDSVIQYLVCVSKDPGVEGQLNLVGGVVTDVMPSGASFAGSTCGATRSGSIITWNVGNLTASYYSSVCCTLSIKYPRSSFPVGTQIQNTAKLTATVGDTIRPNCESIIDSSSVCSVVRAYTNGNISKWVYTNGQPGCGGTYYIVFCNTGNVPLTHVVLMDTVPRGLTVQSATTTGPSAWNPTYSNASNGTLVITNTGGLTLAPLSCITITIDFTIDIGAFTAGTLVNNCAYLRADGIQTQGMCCSFTITNPKPIVCVWKEVCSPKSCYSPGDTLTYRLRVQNIGGATLNSSTITDILDQNLQYLGNVRAYSDNNFNIPCGLDPTDNWGSNLQTTAPNAAYNGVTFHLAPIAFNCHAYGSCGQNGTTVPFYFIEFQIKVRDSSAIGSINNQFSIFGGGLPDTVKSNIVGIDVCANSAYWIEKEVKESNSTTYGTSATISAGGTVNYRLKLMIPQQIPHLASLRFVSMIDELPKDKNPLDQYLMICGNRNSTFGLSFLGTTFNSNASPSAVGVPEMNHVLYPAINTWLPSGCPPNLFASGCSSMAPSSLWQIGSIPTNNKKNFGFYFNQWAFVPSTTIYPWVEFTAKADSAGKSDTIACNSFVASAAVRNIINGGTYFDSPISEVESQPVCINIIPVIPPVTQDTCVTFEDSTISTSHWCIDFVSSMAIVQDPIPYLPTLLTPNHVIRFEDGSGPSLAINNVDFSGNWLVKGVNGCLCFDYKVDWNAAAGSNVGSAPKIGIYYSPSPLCTTAGIISSVRASFVGNTGNPLIQDNVWGHYCLPIGTCDSNGQLPSNSFGSWTVFDASGTVLTGAAACTAWNALISNVTGLYLPTDYNSQPSELVFFDNFCWQCPPPVNNTCCDSLVIDPDSDIESHFTGHRYTIIKNPWLPPICKVKVKYSIAPNVWCCYTGGDVIVDNTSNYLPLAFLHPYDLIDISSAPANNWLSFYYGLNWENVGLKPVTITVIHCNGDSCVYHDVIDVAPLTQVSGLVVSFEEFKDSVKAFNIKIKGNVNLQNAIKYITIDIPKDLGKLMAITSGDYGTDLNPNYMNVASSKMSNQHALFTLSSPLTLKEDEISRSLTVIWSKYAGTQTAPNIKLTLFDVKSNPIGYILTDVTSSTDVKAVTKGYDGSEFDLLKSSPNPIQDNVTLYYTIGSQSDIKLGIYDNLGNELKSFNEGFQPQGLHSIDVNTSDLSSGVYYVRLMSPTRSTTLKLIINK